MALPSSGPLSINDIRVELAASATNQSLGTFSDTAGFTAPDAITDFYGFVNIPTGLSSELYSDNLGSSTSWDIFDGANEIDLSPYNGRTCRSSSPLLKRNYRNFISRGFSNRKYCYTRNNFFKFSI